MSTVEKPAAPPAAVKERRKLAELEHVKGFEFRITFGDVSGEILSDEGPPLGKENGPEPSRLLAAAVGNCLSASLLFCLTKSRIDVRGLKAVSEAVITRNEAKRLRIARIETRIQVDVGDDAAKAARCMSLFEDYCTVTASIREGVPVAVVVETPEGVPLLRREE